MLRNSPFYTQTPSHNNRNYLLFFKLKKPHIKPNTKSILSFPSPHPASNFQLKCNNNNILLAGYELLIHYLLLQMITQQHVCLRNSFDLYVNIYYIIIYLFIRTTE